MRHRPASHATRYALGALALWLVLWTTGDAATGASRTTVIIGDDEGPPPAAVAHCSGRTAEAGDDAPPCCGPACDPGAGPARCPVGKTVRCSQCFSLGGVLLFASAMATLEPDLTVVGLLCPCCLKAPSHDLQPPVPPPWSLA